MDVNISTIFFCLQFFSCFASSALACLTIQPTIHVSEFSYRREPSHWDTPHLPHSWSSAQCICWARLFGMRKWFVCLHIFDAAGCGVFQSTTNFLFVFLTFAGGHGEQCRFCRSLERYCSWHAACAFWRIGRTRRREISGHQTPPGNNICRLNQSFYRYR